MATAKWSHETGWQEEGRRDENFHANFKRLKDTLQGLQDQADEDEAAFLHDQALNLQANNKPYPRWGGSIAECLLKVNIDVGKHEIMKPHHLQATRTEYSFYPPKVFQDHVQQEIHGH